METGGIILLMVLILTHYRLNLIIMVMILIIMMTKIKMKTNKNGIIKKKRLGMKTPPMPSSFYITFFKRLFITISPKTIKKQTFFIFLTFVKYNRIMTTINEITKIKL